MPAKRKITFTNEYWYHVCNRGIEGRDIFLGKRDYLRFLSLLEYYSSVRAPYRYSHFERLSSLEQEKVLLCLQNQPKRITLAAYCLMPNHFHLLIRQNTDYAISKYIADTTNSYSKYLNTKNERKGPLFQGVFRAVFVETDEQMQHVSRYIHINPYVSSLCSYDGVFVYPWSSLASYVFNKDDSLIEKSELMTYFKTKELYKKFIEGQISSKKDEDMQNLYIEE